MATIDPHTLTIALPSGSRMKRLSIGCLSAAGLELPNMDDTRSLRFYGQGVTVLEVKDPDVPVYVDLGVADIGIAGKDVILESNRDVYEPVDLGFGVCRISLIALPNMGGRLERVASKYYRITQRYLKERGLPADVIKLSGKIELAALTGLADAVVDVVETGTTLKQNGLEELEVLHHSSARLIVNRAALKLKRERIQPLLQRLRG